LKKYIIYFLICAAIALVVFNRVRIGSRKIKLIHVGEMISDNVYYSPYSCLIGNLKYYIFVTMGEASFSCPTGDVIMIIDEMQQKLKDYKFNIIFFDSYTKADLANIKSNNNLSVEFIAASSALQQLHREGLFQFGQLVVCNNLGKVCCVGNIIKGGDTVTNNLAKVIDQLQRM